VRRQAKSRGMSYKEIHREKKRIKQKEGDTGASLFLMYSSPLPFNFSSTL